MTRKGIIERKVLLADMHLNGVYFDPNILAALKSQSARLVSLPIQESNK